ncbi:hypothetical protein P1S80_15640, partial [Escherichia coli]|nr:hypothetical protein [Escherichia coli]
LKEFCRRNDACMTSQVMIYSGKFYFNECFINCTFRCQIMSNIWGAVQSSVASGIWARLPDAA